MRGTEHFKQTIKTFLDNKASEDELFAQKYNNPNKNLDDCVTYILNWVQASGCSGFSDMEIYGQCIHYFDEDSIDIGKPIECNVVVNHHIELTDEEKSTYIGQLGDLIIHAETLKQVLKLDADVDVKGIKADAISSLDKRDDING